jgi:hypothetical protein
MYSRVEKLRGWMSHPFALDPSPWHRSVPDDRKQDYVIPSNTILFFLTWKLWNAAWYDGIFRIVLIFCGVTPYSIMESCRRFRGTYCDHHDGHSCSEMSTNFCYATRRNIPSLSPPWEPKIFLWNHVCNRQNTFYPVKHSTLQTTAWQIPAVPRHYIPGCTFSFQLGRVVICIATP